MVRCTALAFCTQLQVAISVYDASNAAPCAWHAQSANARKGPSCIEPMATNSLHHKAQVSIKEASDKPNPYSAYFFSPTWPSLAAAKQNSNSPDFRKLECACLTIDPEVAKSPTNGYTMGCNLAELSRSQEQDVSSP